MSVRVLSVEPHGTLGLSPLDLPGHTDDWQVDRVPSLRRAIERLKSQRYDLLILDHRAPVPQGIEFLTKVRDHMPRVARLTVVALGDTAMAELVAPSSHDVLAVPGLADELRDTGERVVAMLAGDHPSALVEMSKHLDRLPARPGIYNRLQSEIQAGSSMDKIGRLLEHDVGITAQLINLANSAFFAFKTPSRSAGDAVARLGINCTAGVVLSATASRGLGVEHRRAIERTNQHSVELANLVRAVAGNDDRLSLAALLHDIGQVAIMVMFPVQALPLYSEDHNENDLCWHERALTGVDHAVLGGYLLRRWKIDPAVARIVELHHEPWKARPDDPDEVVEFASLLACLHLLEDDAPLPAGADDGFADLVDDLRAAVVPLMAQL